MTDPRTIDERIDAINAQSKAELESMIFAVEAALGALADAFRERSDKVMTGAQVASVIEASRDDYRPIMLATACEKGLPT